jgi:hypothetical protein
LTVKTSRCLRCNAEKEQERPLCPACDTQENRVALRQALSGPSAMMMLGAVLTVTLIGAPIGITLIVVGARLHRKRRESFALPQDEQT